MKLEMGESLVFSWLKHEKHCQVVQMNWKSSPEWNAFVSNKELDRIYKKSRKLFNYVSTNVKDSDQLIKQGEIDVIGIELDMENSGNVKNIHAVDVAFHEAGLNYGGEQETMERIVKKYIRTALSIYKFFGNKSADIYFVTPIIRDKNKNTYVEAKNSVEKFFEEEGFGFSFHLYSNEDFIRFIFNPVKRSSQIVSDTSELFARSLKLLRLMDGEGKEEEKNAVDIKETAYNLDEEKKIGVIVRESFDDLSHNQLLSKEQINNLQSAKYSKDTFLLNRPVLIINDNEDQRFDERGRARYYATPYKFNGTEYFLCNDWYERNKSKFIEWYNQIIAK
jgi:hypothetical protein